MQFPENSSVRQKKPTENFFYAPKTEMGKTSIMVVTMITIPLKLM